MPMLAELTLRETTMTDRIAITAAESVRDGSALPVTLRFRADGADAAPTSLKYCVDFFEGGCAVLDWTSHSPAASVSITIPAAANTSRSCWPVERRQLVVMVDEGLAGQKVEVFGYEVHNVHAVR